METTKEITLKLLEPTPVYFGQKIRVLVDEINNLPWFVVVDVCKALDLQGSSGIHMRRLDPNDINVLSKHVISGRGRNHAIVSEPGFYELVLGSRKPGAVAFKRWVCSEVLPSIRRTGQYQVYADESGNPVDIPDVVVELVKTLPEPSDDEPRIHIWEFLEELEGVDLDRQQRANLGKIARRLLLTHDLPILSKWSSFRQRHWLEIKGGRVYPRQILEKAWDEYANKGRRD